MALSSMTGFARASGAADGLHWQWEVKSVNGKGLETRCRLAAGFEHLEAPVRESVMRRFKRGNLQLSLSCDHGSSKEVLSVNEAALEQLLAISERLRARLGGELPRIDGLLGLRGVVEVVSEPVDPDVAARRDRAMLESLDVALTQLAGMRADEGERLGQVLNGQLDRIAQLTAQARDCPARRPQAIKARLAEQVAKLLDVHAGLDDSRLHQEAVLIATRVDIQEEVDRLFAHVEAARALLAAKEPAGRKLEFLAQEFNREANTLCSKAIDHSVTAIGLDLKTVIDQLREQVQNIE
ncbi:MAG: YicC family protein [Rhizobiales bacterium]|nr:YicC family protein [Hyphomicrobiales bacterium]